jgi:hypothetical protein
MPKALEHAQLPRSLLHVRTFAVLCTAKSRLSDSIGSLQGKKPPNRRFFEVLCTKRNKLLEIKKLPLPGALH